METTQIFEWAGAIFGIFGAFLLAINSIRFSRFGWIAFLVANFAMIAFAYRINAEGLKLQQYCFMLTSLIGLYKAGFFSYLTGNHPETVNSVSLSMEEWLAIRAAIERNIGQQQVALRDLGDLNILEPGLLNTQAERMIKMQQQALKKLPEKKDSTE